MTSLRDDRLVMTPPRHAASPEVPQQEPRICVCVVTIRPNGDHLLYQTRYRLGLSVASAETVVRTVDIEDLFSLLRAISGQL